MLDQIWIKTTDEIKRYNIFNMEYRDLKEKKINLIKY